MTGANRHRIRRLECIACGTTVWISRANMMRGLPSCACGAGELRPTDPGDLVELGLLELDDLPRRERTRLCKRMGWEDEIVRTSPAQMPGSRRPYMLRLPRSEPTAPF